MHLIDTKANLYDPASNPPPIAQAKPAPLAPTICKFSIGDTIVIKGVPFRDHKVSDYIRHPTTGAVVGYEIIDHNSMRCQHSLAKAHMHFEHKQYKAPGAGTHKVSGSVMKSGPSFAGGFKTAAMEEKWEVEHFLTFERKSACDCGAHKCGYKDSELHGHAGWCKLNEITNLITHGEKS
jgi:hypothetical protein